jgi:hypothetical protein
LLLCCSCKIPDKKDDLDTAIEKAKWYYYAFNANQQFFVDSDTCGKASINLAECGLRVLRIDTLGTDSIRYIFFPYNTQKIYCECQSEPYEIAGVTMIRNEIFIPSIHGAIFEYKNWPEDALNRMKLAEEKLLLLIKQNKGVMATWLYEEAKRRKILLPD